MGEPDQPLVNCTICSGLLKYNSTKFATYEPNGTELVITTNGWIRGEGFVSGDTISVGGGVHIPHHPFLEANTTFLPTLPLDIDTTLGLAIDKPCYQDPSHLFFPSLFATLVAEGDLDRNVVSIHLPRDDGDLGDLLFGGLGRYNL